MQSSSGDTLGYRAATPFTRLFWLWLIGRSVVWIGSLEVAELKADQMVGCGADPAQRNRGAEPLRVTVEATE